MFNFLKGSSLSETAQAAQKLGPARRWEGSPVDSSAWTGSADVEVAAERPAPPAAVAVLERPVAPLAPTMPAKPEPLAWNPTPLPDLSEYREVAAVLGFEPADIRKHTLEVKRREVIEFLLDKGYPMYGEDAVRKYMDGLVAKMNEGRGPYVDHVYWHWAPLAAKTQIVGVWESTPDGGRRPTAATRERHVPGYAHAVPLFALKRAAAIKKQFGDEVEFFVTDYASRNPDPFLAVRRDGGDLLIFAVWDEPTFGL